MSSMVPYSQIHEQKQQRPLAPSGYHNAREPTFRDPFPSGAPAPHPHPLGNVPRNQQFAEGSEYYTWVSKINSPTCRTRAHNEALLMCHRPEQLINSTPRQPQYEFRVRKIADHIILRQFRYQVQIQYRRNDCQLILSSPITNSNRGHPNPPLINSRTRATGIPILTAMTRSINHPNRTIIAQRVLLLGITEPLNAPGMAPPTRAVGVLQSAPTDLFSAIIEIVENDLQLIVSGGKLEPLVSGNLGSGPHADFCRLVNI